MGNGGVEGGGVKVGEGGGRGRSGGGQNKEKVRLTH